jgi:uncharacterized protein (UPF0262 family)
MNRRMAVSYVEEQKIFPFATYADNKNNENVVKIQHFRRQIWSFYTLCASLAMRDCFVEKQ